MAPSPTELGRQARTLLHLHPAQVGHRLRLQAQRRIVARDPGRAAERWRRPVGGRTGLPASFRAVDAAHLAHRWDPADLADATFEFLNERRRLGDPVDWDPADASQLWRFHLHYWEWAWSLAAGGPEAQATFSRLHADWTRSTTFGRWDAWAPYPASLRAWVLVNVHRDLAAGTDLAGPLTADIALHGGFLAHNLELDVGGNHLVKNIKGLVGCAVFLHDEGLLDLARRHLDRELDVQVLPDGGHYELSPSYHCQVLADLADVAGLLAADGRPPVPALDDAVARMRTWLGELIQPDGSLPLLNDAEPVDPDLLTLLHPVAARPRPLAVLPDSGYAVVRAGPFHLVADVGQPGPPSPPGHIHADCLSFTLHVDGRPAVVDTGTSEYGSGPRRRHERSTAAHNTVEIDGTDQTEVFGAFRAGRRARTTLERAEVGADGTVTVTASHDGYRHLPGRPLHRRTWIVTPDAVVVQDQVDGDGVHDLAARLHLPVEPVEPVEPAEQPDRPDHGPVSTRVGLVVIGTEVGQGARPPAVTIDACQLARGFGHLAAGSVHTTKVRTELPAVLTTTLAVPLKNPVLRPTGNPTTPG